jgi:DNA integrity scanning protein DisA with diadenylate cyclase activity
LLPIRYSNLNLSFTIPVTVNVVLKLPEGYGTRHASVAGITQMTNAIGFVVSTTWGKISVMRNGEIRKAFVV